MTLIEKPAWWLRRGGPRPLGVEVCDVRVRFDVTTPVGREWLMPRCSESRVHERAVATYLLQRLRHDSVFLDIGANVGFYAVLAATRCRDGSAHAIEIDPDLVTEVRRSAALNELDNLTTLCAAAWDSDGEVLSMAPRIDGNRSTTRAVAGGGGGSCVTVTIDRWCESLGVEPDAIKIDIEGAEVRALRGMTRVLAGVRLMLLEFHPGWLGEFGGEPREVVDRLGEHGFRVMGVEQHKSASPRIVSMAPDDVAGLDRNCMLICERETGR